jgi:hypothetical protein
LKAQVEGMPNRISLLLTWHGATAGKMFILGAAAAAAADDDDDDDDDETVQIYL